MWDLRVLELPCIIPTAPFLHFSNQAAWCAVKNKTKQVAVLRARGPWMVIPRHGFETPAEGSLAGRRARLL